MIVVALASAWGGIREDQFVPTAIILFALLSLASWLNHRYGGEP